MLIWGTSYLRLGSPKRCPKPGEGDSWARTARWSDGHLGGHPGVWGGRHHTTKVDVLAQVQCAKVVQTLAEWAAAEDLALDRSVAGYVAQVRAGEALEACFPQAACACRTQALAQENPQDAVGGGWRHDAKRAALGSVGLWAWWRFVAVAFWFVTGRLRNSLQHQRSWTLWQLLLGLESRRYSVVRKREDIIGNVRLTRTEVERLVAKAQRWRRVRELNNSPMTTATCKFTYHNCWWLNRLTKTFASRWTMFRTCVFQKSFPCARSVVSCCFESRSLISLAACIRPTQNSLIRVAFWDLIRSVRHCDPDEAFTRKSFTQSLIFLDDGSKQSTGSEHQKLLAFWICSVQVYGIGQPHARDRACVGWSRAAAVVALDRRLVGLCGGSDASPLLVVDVVVVVVVVVAAVLPPGSALWNGDLRLGTLVPGSLRQCGPEFQPCFVMKSCWHGRLSWSQVPLVVANAICDFLWRCSWLRFLIFSGQVWWQVHDSFCWTWGPAAASVPTVWTVGKKCLAGDEVGVFVVVVVVVVVVVSVLVSAVVKLLAASRSLSFFASLLLLSFLLLGLLLLLSPLLLWLLFLFWKIPTDHLGWSWNPI